MKNIKIMLSSIQNKTKPAADSMPSIRKSMKEVNITIEELCNAIKNGQSFIGSTFKTDDNQKIENFKNCSLAIMDFDNGIWDERSVLNFCKNNNILPNIYYRSWSYTTSKPKMHLVWVLADEIDNYETAKSLQKLIYLAFSLEKKVKKKEDEEDKMSYQPIQVWGGTCNKCEVMSQNYINYNDLMKCIELHYDKNHQSEAKKKISQFCAIENIVYVYQYNWHDIEHTSNVHNIYQEDNRIAVIKNIKEYAKNNDYIDFRTGTSANTLLSRCRLCNELCDSKQDYYKHELNYGLLTSLVNIENGKDIYLKLCSKNGSKSEYRYERDFDIAKSKFYPEPCHLFCPYSSNCEYGKYTAAYAAKASNSLKVIHDPNSVKQITVDEAYNQAFDLIKNAMKDTKNQIINMMINNNNEQCLFEAKRTMKKLSDLIDIIQVGTGVGKTRIIVNIIKSIAEENASLLMIKDYNRDYIEGIMYSASTHKICDEVYEELMSNQYVKSLGITRVTERPVHFDKKIEAEFEEYEELGIFELLSFKQKKIFDELKLKYKIIDDILDKDKKNEMIESIVKTNEDKKEYEYYVLLKEYINSRINAKDSKIIICTHAYLKTLQKSISSFTHINYIIIDEDCVQSYTQQNKFKLSTLRKMRNNIEKMSYKYRNNDYSYDDLVAMLDFILDKSKRDKLYTYDVSKRLEYKIKSKTEHKKGMPASKLEELVKNKIEDKINYTALLKIKGFYIHDEYFFYQTCDKIPTDSKKVIMLSATPAPSSLIQKICKDNAEIKLSKTDWVKNKGDFKQYQSLKCYKKDIDNDDSNILMDKIDSIAEEENIDKIITFKGYENIFPGYDVSMTYGNAIGVNNLKGEQVMVIGTYLQNPQSVNLISTLFEEDDEEINTKNEAKDFEQIRNYKINFNGIEQMFPTFQEGILRDYAMWQTWQNMEQAIGRVRLVREEGAKVILLSQLIHPLAYQF